MPFHLSSCIFYPHASIFALHLFTFLPFSVQTSSISPLSSITSMIPGSQSTPRSLSSPIDLPRTLLRLPSLLKTNTPQVEPHSPHPHCRWCVCSGIRLSFVQLRKEGTNQSLICHCILRLIVRKGT